MTKGRKDLAGKKFGRLLVLSKEQDRIMKGKKQTTWLCVCDCGTQKIVPSTSLRRDEFVSCGCARKSLEYKAWYHMLSRCRNPNSHMYKSYGGRGIYVCERWWSFENFYADMSPHPGQGYSLDRIDVNGNYEPGNCRWATKKEQVNNTRRNVFVEYKGTKYILNDLAKLVGMNQQVLRARLLRGIPIDDAVQLTGTGKKATEEAKANMRAAWIKRKTAGRIVNRRMEVYA